MSDITQRKQDHIQALLQDKEIERNQSDFDQIRLIHRALPELNFSEIDSTTEFLEKELCFPFMISSMTGGASDNLVKINQNLALAAEHCQVAMGVGSQRAMIQDPTALNSFKLRQYAPTIPLIANMGAVQLNYGFGIPEAQKIIDTLEADALYLHLNPLQELIQPEGNTNFSNLIEKIHQLSQALDVPIILKEVGSGFSPPDMEAAISAQVKWIDISGRGGTSWSRIEAHRNDAYSAQQLGLSFQDWGMTTREVLTLAQPYASQINFIASGGIRNGIDMVKSVIMGAQICGVAAPLLAPAMNSEKEVVQKIKQYQREFQTTQFLLGARKTTDLFLNPSLILNAINQ